MESISDSKEKEKGGVQRVLSGKERSMLEIILYVAIGATIGTITGNLIVWVIAEIADRISGR